MLRTGSGVAKELKCMTYGHELRVLEGMGVPGGEGAKGGKFGQL